MAYSIRPAIPADIPHIVRHRVEMFREMGIAARFTEMAAATDTWLRHAIPNNTYRGWVTEDAAAQIVAGGGLLVIPYPPGPITMDPRCGFIFNVYTDPGHRQKGLARGLMHAMHEWCRGQGIERVVLNASAFGKALYEDMGYVTAEEPFMRLRLTR